MRLSDLGEASGGSSGCRDKVKKGEVEGGKRETSITRNYL